MKKLYLLLIIIGQLVNAQVGINTTNPNAQLDIRSSNQASPLPTDGIMIPKVDTLIFPTAAQNGIMVFLTNSTTFLGSAKTPGFYYWDNTAADWLGLGSNTGWSTEGNTGTNPANNFIGTKDNADLVFKINNNPAGRLNQFNTSFGYNSLLNPVNLDNSAFGTSALSNIRFGSDNIAIGSSAMFFNQDGRRDIAIGNNALRTTTNSNDNLAIGHSAMNATTTGEFNIAIGNSALQSGGTGNNNIAVGYQSQFSNSFGSDNVSVGKIALQNNTFGSGNTAIGNYTLGGTFMENSTALGTRALSGSNGQDNTGVGYQALDDNSSGRFNTGVGSNALGGNSSGDNNTSVGYNSLLGNGSGSKNTAIGANATTSMNNLTNATAIGANAIVADNNSMVLGSVAGFNNSFDNTKVGIGTIVPTERLHVVGRIRMEDGNQGNGKVLVGDNNGVASWQNVNGFAWSTTGNFFTDSNVNFIGTSDPMDLVFKRNNIRSGLLSEENTIFGFNTHFSGQRNSVFGSHPFAGTLGGSNNSVFGYQALNACTSCGDNAVFGTNAMLFNTFGGANTAVGTDALRVNNSGNFNTAVGYNAAPNIGSGNGNVAIGSNALKNISFTNNNTGLGSETNFGGGVITNSTAIGAHAQVDFSNSIVLGSVNGVNGATSSVNVGIGTTNPSERLHVVGSIRMEDGSQGAGKVLTSDANGKASWVTPATPTVTVDSGTLDEAYDSGGAGNGRTITADTGAVNITGPDGLVSIKSGTGGAVAPSGTGTRMVWNPLKSAFRAGSVFTTEWDDTNIGSGSIAFGVSTISSANQSSAFGFSTIASGNVSAAFGSSTTASGANSASFGALTTASGIASSAFGQSSSAQGYGETALGIGATTYTLTANGATQFRTANQSDRIFVIGNAIDANNNNVVDVAERRDAVAVLKSGQTGIGISRPNARLDIREGNVITASDTQFGNLNVMTTGAQAANFGGSISLGGFTDNIASVASVFGTIEGRKMNGTSGNKNGYLSFKTNGGAVDALVERMRITDAGFVGIGTPTPLDRLHVAGNIRMVDGNQAVGKVLTSDANGTGTWQNITFPAFTGWGLNGNVGTNDPAVPFAYGASVIGAAENWTGTTDANDYVIGTNNIERFRIKQTTGFVGIGTSNPARRLHVFNGASGGVSTSGSNVVIESNFSTYQQFLTPSTMETGVLFGSELGSLRGGMIYSHSSDLLQLRAGNAGRVYITAAGDVGIGMFNPGGQFELTLNEGRKPSSNLWAIPSDARLKNIDGSYDKGLTEISKLKPIRYHYKNTDKRTFDPKVLQAEAYGFLAQEVQKVFPEAIGTDPDGYLNFDLHPILIASVNALKELGEKNAQLQSENEMLKAKLKQHDEQIAKILVELEKRK